MPPTTPQLVHYQSETSIITALENLRPKVLMKMSSSLEFSNVKRSVSDVVLVPVQASPGETTVVLANNGYNDDMPDSNTSETTGTCVTSYLQSIADSGIEESTNSELSVRLVHQSKPFLAKFATNVPSSEDDKDSSPDADSFVNNQRLLDGPYLSTDSFFKDSVLSSLEKEYELNLDLPFIDDVVFTS